jgi:hypothetical protein
MKHLLIILGVLVAGVAVGQDEKYIRMQDSIRKLWKDTTLFFPQHKYVKVIGYTFNKNAMEEGEQSILIAKTNKLAKSVDPKNYILTKQNTKTLLNILNDTTSFVDGDASCFIPHHAFVFYDEKDLPIANITICFTCYQTESKPKTPIMRYGGLDDRGWKKLYDFCKGLGMPINEVK